MQSPVALILFNRPDKVDRVMRAIAAARPPKLFLIADGPRPDRPDDAAKCSAARDAAERLISWDCEVFRNYSDSNLGCGWRPASGISWVFEHAEGAIILEDDCVPHPTFFPFCDDLLIRYKDDERIAQIAGNFHQYGQKRGAASYFFSRQILCAGGWATWRRSWKHFSMTIDLWPQLRETPWLFYTHCDQRSAQYWRALFDAAHAAKGKIDCWDYQWTFACWVQSGLSIVPNVGLVTNIGFGPDGTHTTWTNDKWANLPMSEMTFPMKHPPCVIPDGTADFFRMDQVDYRTPPTLQQRVREKLYDYSPGPIRRLASWLQRKKKRATSQESKYVGRG